MNSKKVKQIRREVREAIKEMGYAEPDPELVKRFTKVMKKRVKNGL